MATLEALNSSPNGSVAELSELEVGVIDFFVSAVKVLGFPKSIGEIYGLLFVSSEPLPLDTLVDRLRMSKGSASQGLRALKGLGAVREITVENSRRCHYQADIELTLAPPVYCVVSRLSRGRIHLPQKQ